MTKKRPKYKLNCANKGTPLQPVAQPSQVQDLRQLRQDRNVKLWSDTQRIDEENAFKDYKGHRIPIPNCTFISNGLICSSPECMPANEKLNCMTICVDYYVFTTGVFPSTLIVHHDSLVAFFAQNRALPAFGIVIDEEASCDDFVWQMERDVESFKRFMAGIKELTIFGNYSNNFITLILQCSPAVTSRIEVPSQESVDSLSQDKHMSLKSGSTFCRVTSLTVQKNTLILEGINLQTCVSVPISQAFEALECNTAASYIDISFDTMESADNFATATGVDRREQFLKFFLRQVTKLSFSGCVTPSLVKSIMSCASNVKSLYFYRPQTTESRIQADYCESLEKCLVETKDYRIESLWVDFTNYNNVGMNGVLKTIATVFDKGNVSFLRVVVEKGCDVNDILKCLHWTSTILAPGGSAEVFVYDWRNSFGKQLLKGFEQFNDVQYWEKQSDDYMRWFVTFLYTWTCGKKFTIFLARKWLKKTVDFKGKSDFDDMVDKADFGKFYDL